MTTYQDKYYRYKRKYLELKIHNIQTGGDTYRDANIVITKKDGKYILVQDAERIFNYFKLTLENFGPSFEFPTYTLPKDARNLVVDDFTPHVAICSKIAECEYENGKTYYVYATHRNPSGIKPVKYIDNPLTITELVEKQYEDILNNQDKDEFKTFMLAFDTYLKANYNKTTFSWDIHGILDAENLIKEINESGEKKSKLLEFSILYYTDYAKFPNKFADTYIRYTMLDDNSGKKIFWSTVNIDMQCIGTIKVRAKKNKISKKIKLNDLGLRTVNTLGAGLDSIE